MTIKSEPQYQMYLDVLDILLKKGFTTKVEKDGMGMKSSKVYSGDTLCGKVTAVSTPPANRESSIYAMSAHAKLIAYKEETRSAAENDRIKGHGAFANFKEGAHTGADDCLYYCGNAKAGGDEHKWVEIVDKNFLHWRENSPLYFQTVNETEKMKKKNLSSAEDFSSAEKEFKRLAEIFLGISDYRDALDLSEECEKIIPDKKADILKAAIKKMEKLNKSKGTTSKYFNEMVKDYKEVSEKFGAIVPFPDAAEKLAECEAQIEKCERNAINAFFDETVAEMKKLQSLDVNITSSPSDLEKIISDYEAVLVKFSSIEKHKGAAEKIAFCKGEIGKYKTYHSAAIYKEATAEHDELEERPEKESFSEDIYRARKYKKTAKKFKKIIPYDDSAKMEKKCKTMYKALRWKITKKIAPFILAFIAVVAIAGYIIITQM